MVWAQYMMQGDGGIYLANCPHIVCVEFARQQYWRLLASRLSWTAVKVTAVCEVGISAIGRQW